MSTEPQPTPLSRRGLLGSVALGSGLAGVGATSAVGATPAPVRLHRFETRQQFGTGWVDGVRVTTLGLIFGRASATRSYTDPYAARPVATTWQVGTWISPPLRAGFDLTELVASWNVQTPSGTWVEISVRGTTPTGVRTDWFILGRWCSSNPAEGGAIHRTSVDGQQTAVATVLTDTLATVEDQKLRTVELRVQLMRKPGTVHTPKVRQLTAMVSALPDATTVTPSVPGRAKGKVLAVPTYSQEIHAGQYPEGDNGGEAWCSPTSVAMVADFFKQGPSAAETAWVSIPPDRQVDHAARATYDYAYDGCGNWPFNIAYAASLGLRGFVTRLRSLAEAEAFIVAGVPLVLSVSFKSSELDGAGYSTSGHLLVLIGFDAKGNPVVNDPASHLIPDNRQVRVTYRRDQLEKVWVPHSGGLAYVLHPARHKLPAAPSQPNW